MYTSLQTRLDISHFAFHSVQRTQLSRFTAGSGLVVDWYGGGFFHGCCVWTQLTAHVLRPLTCLNWVLILLHYNGSRIFTREFPASGDSTRLLRQRYVSLFVGDTSHIVTVCGSQLDLYNIRSNVNSVNHCTVKDRVVPARCVAHSERGEIYIGLNGLQRGDCIWW